MNNRLYVANLAARTTQRALRDLFAEFGEVIAVDLLDAATGRPRGYSIVTMGNPEDARRALTQVSGRLLDGRALRVDEI